jgi:hypothetical protein
MGVRYDGGWKGYFNNNGNLYAGDGGGTFGTDTFIYWDTFSGTIEISGNAEFAGTFKAGWDGANGPTFIIDQLNILRCRNVGFEAASSDLDNQLNVEGGLIRALLYDQSSGVFKRCGTFSAVRISSAATGNGFGVQVSDIGDPIHGYFAVDKPWMITKDVRPDVGNDRDIGHASVRYERGYINKAVLGDYSSEPSSPEVGMLVVRDHDELVLHNGSFWFTYGIGSQVGFW